MSLVDLEFFILFFIVHNVIIYDFSSYALIIIVIISIIIMIFNLRKKNYGKIRYIITVELYI